MTKQEILLALTDIMRDVFDREDIVITNDTTADDIDEWDSLSHIHIIVAAEGRFKIKFMAAETEELKHVGELVDLIEQRIKS